MSANNKLRILVPIKRVIDHQLAPRISSSTSLKIPSYSINPFDDIALEESLRINEKNKGLVEEIKAISVGSIKCKDLLYKALAKGCHQAKLIETPVTSTILQPLSIAKILKKEVEKNNYNLVILGKQAIDDDNNNTGQMLAGLLNWPQICNASKVEIVDPVNGEIQVSREVDSGEEILKSKWPVVITADLRLNTPRYATLPKIMKAKKKKIEQEKLLETDDLNNDQSLKVLSYKEPPKRQPGIRVANVDELLSKLKEVKAI
ncbi:related to Probable electron transfer flavoprotein subunit beta [Saccharomycodes ludwigii]|uniref:Probable electron transfer flavoprotein subunit beta n=1 Tax=Saccharomycodes ludwigii TaxID=36035 RepID=A0A376B962_9ASCO|nr:related to Probable electron transfer flavoprotein subunit beta [Saccharomycodes ludwigii]